MKIATVQTNESEQSNKSKREREQELAGANETHGIVEDENSFHCRNIFIWNASSDRGEKSSCSCYVFM